MPDFFSQRASVYGLSKDSESKITGSGASGSFYDQRQSAYSGGVTRRQPQQQEVTKIADEPKEEKKNLLSKARGVFQNLGYKEQQTGKGLFERSKDWVTSFGKEVKSTAKPALQQMVSTAKVLPIAVPDVFPVELTAPKKWQINILRKVKGEKPITDEQYKRVLERYISQEKQKNIEFEQKWFNWAMKDRIKAQKYLSQNPIEADSYENFSDKIKDPQYLARGLTMNLPNFAFTTSVGLATGGIGVIPTAVMLEGGNFYTEAREDGLSDEDATRLASAYGVLSGIVEAIVPGELGEGQLVTRLLKGNLTKEIVGSVTRAGLEGATEVVQEILANSFKRTYNENQTLFEGWKEAGFFGVLIGALGDGSLRVTNAGNILATGVKFNKEGTEIVGDESVMDADDVIDKIINSKAQDTPQGKEILKVALEAQRTEQSVRIDTTNGELTVEIVPPGTSSIPESIRQQAKQADFATPLDEVLTKVGEEETQRIDTQTRIEQANKVVKQYKQAEVVEPKVFRGSKGEVTEQGIDFKRVMVVPKDQYDLMVQLAKAGNKDAQAHIDSLPRGVRRVDYTISDRIIRDAFQDQYDAIQYNNEQLKAKGKEWHDLKNNRFYAQERLTAEQYSKQKRGGKYAQKTKEAGRLPRKSEARREKTVGKTARTKVKRVSEAQTRHDKINEYIKNRNVIKFREGDIDTLQDVEQSAVTTKFLEDPQVKGREKASYSFLDNLSRSNKLGLKPKEQLIIKRVLDQHFLNEKNIDMKEFRRLVIGELMPINTIKSSTYADYGSDNIQIDADNTTTYILDAPYKHGETGHFSQDYRNIPLSKDQVEIREIPAQEGNPRAKWAVVQKGVQLTEENIQENVFTVATSKENAQKWIEEQGQLYQARPKSGLFSHYRAFDVDNIAHVAEVQSDVFQNLERIDESLDLKKRLTNLKQTLADNEQYLKQQKRLLERTGDERFKDSVDRAESSIQTTKTEISTLEERLKNLSDKSKEQAQFLDYKNIWHERTVREAIRTKALEGFETIRFPTPRTIAFIEGYTSEDGGMPYQIIQADDEKRLKPGDLIDYGGEGLMVVSANDYQITVALSDEVNSFDNDAYIEDDLNSRWEDIEYEFRKIEKTFGEIDSTEKARAVIDAQGVLNDLLLYKNIDKDVKQTIDKYMNPGSDISELLERVKNQKNSISEINYFKSQVEKGVLAEKEVVKADLEPDVESQVIPLARDLGANDLVVMIVRNAMNDIGSTDGVTKDTYYKLLKKRTLERINDTVSELEENIKTREERVEKLRGFMEEDLKKIGDRKKPTQEDLNKLKVFAKSSQEIIDSLPEWMTSYDFEENIRDILDAISQGEINDVTDFYDIWKEKEIESGYDPDYEGIYQEVYYDGDQVYAVNGHSETFQQPDEYEPAVGIEEFNIEDYDETQQVVLRFYERQLNRYIQKLRKGNIELVEDDQGFEWYESKLTEEDKNATIAFRLKDDLAEAGIMVTDSQEQEIIDLNKKIFGDDNIKITSQILANNKALGAYSQKMIEILGKQANPKDTFFHEAVHKYIDVFTTKDEQFSLFEEGMKKYKTDDMALVEEKIAEDFIKYANNANSIKGILARFFKKIFNRIKAFNKNASQIEKLYEEIITGKAKTKAKAKPRVKASKVAVSIEQNLNQRFENLAGFETRTVKSQSDLISKFIAKDIDMVRNIVTGKEPLPAGMSGSMFIAGVEEYATRNNDLDLIRSLATSPLVSATSVNAQELRFLAEREKTSVLARVQELASERARVFKKRYKKITQEKAIKQEVKKIKESTVKVSKYDWNAFINSIEC